MLALRVYRTDYRRDRNGAHALRANVVGDGEQLDFVERRDFPSFEFMTAVRKALVVADCRSQVFGPVDHRC